MQHAFVAVKRVRLIGGAVALDFVNTCNGRRPDTSLEKSEERLNSFEFFFEWALHASLMTVEEHDQWAPLATGQREMLEPLLDAVKSFRESLFSLFFSVSQGHSVAPQMLHPLNTALQRTLTSRFLTVLDERPAWAWKPCTNTQDVADLLIGRLANNAQELLTGQDLVHLKCCSSSECDWLFLDSSKNKQRRWCQMSVCGSREKLQRNRQISDRIKTPSTGDRSH